MSLEMISEEKLNEIVKNLNKLMEEVQILKDSREEKDSSSYSYEISVDFDDGSFTGDDVYVDINFSFDDLEISLEAETVKLSNEAAYAIAQVFKLVVFDNAEGLLHVLHNYFPNTYKEFEDHFTQKKLLIQ
jgi:hypothetical protein